MYRNRAVDLWLMHVLQLCIIWSLTLSRQLTLKVAHQAPNCTTSCLITYLGRLAISTVSTGHIVLHSKVSGRTCDPPEEEGWGLVCHNFLVSYSSHLPLTGIGTSYGRKAKAIRSRNKVIKISLCNYHNIY